MKRSAGLRVHTGETMPDAYMMSLQRPWSDLTVDGTKTMELRRSGRAIPPGSTVYIYESGAKGARAIVGSVVMDGTRKEDAQLVAMSDPLREQHRVSEMGVLLYARAQVACCASCLSYSAHRSHFDEDDRLRPGHRVTRADALTCIMWRRGSAVRFPTPIPAPCKAVPTWRKLSVGEVIEIKVSVEYAAYIDPLRDSACTVCGVGRESMCPENPVVCPLGGGLC